jgi:hypothetical protein
MSLASYLNAYSDEIITATELNRQPGTVLDKATEHPVTITRGDRAFALLPRENIAFLVKGVRQSRNVIEILSTAFRLLRGENISSENPCAWLKVFDLDEIGELIAELTRAFEMIESSSINAWDLIESIIYEWHESAIAISSPELANALNDETDEILLTPPFLDNAA